MSSLTSALGGYFELELSVRNQNWLPQAYKFNSARAAFASLVDQLEINTVWIPRYLCDSMISVLNDREIQIEFYDLAEDFTIKSEVNLGEHCLLLYVNYFGICNEQSMKVISQYGTNNVVIDNSQAMFSTPFSTLATIYSPRKFFGLPDGGLLCSDDSRIKQPARRDDTSEARMDHLISRLTYSPEIAYQKYLDAEHAIGELPVLGMSRLTERLLLSIDYDAVKAARSRNARYLHARLREYNQLDLDLSDHRAPLSYPFLPNVKTASRSELIKKRVFLPNYWEEVLTRVEEGSFEWNLVTNGLFLPCDQRYTEEDMDRLISLLIFT